jgi:sterol desaturase/sphingolipid hydroxylase (fatty acid hydroxylase superfamily)
MDWIGNFRFHWTEIILYHTIKYLPLLVLGAEARAVLIAAAIATAIGHLNHSNLAITWGPLRYVLNSPRMHIWHHDIQVRDNAGVNFAVVFSLWDWVFRTAYMPEKGMPGEIGFKGEKKIPANLLWRFFLPFAEKKPG